MNDALQAIGQAGAREIAAAARVYARYLSLYGPIEVGELAEARQALQEAIEDHAVDVAVALLDRIDNPPG